MNREKVLELARAVYDTDFGLAAEERLLRFAAMIEAEMCKYQADKFCETHCSWTDHHVDCDQVRGDGEPVASVHIKDGCLVGSQRKSGANFPDGQYGLYPIGTYPAPTVVRQLVDGLAGLIDFIEIDNLKIDQDALRIARAALAAAKDAGL